MHGVQIYKSGFWTVVIMVDSLNFRDGWLLSLALIDCENAALTL